MNFTLSDLLSHPSCHDSTFCFRGGGDDPVFYHVYKGYDQLVLSSESGLHNAVMKGLYDAALRGHLGSAKALESL